MSARILPIDDPFVQKTLRDFRVKEKGEKWVARLKGEGRFQSAVFPELKEKTPQVLVELISQSEWKKELPNLAVRWLVALRLPYLLFSLLPLLLVLCSYYQMDRGQLPSFTYLLFACVILIHLSCNLWSDYEDHLRGLDNPDHSGGSGAIQKLWIPAVHLRNAAAIMFIIGFVFGLMLFAQMPFSSVGKHLLWIGALSVLAAASYSGWPFHYKYFGLGEPVVFILSGPLVTIGASLLYFRDSSYFPFFACVSVPLAILATLRLHAGNMQRIPFDAMAKTNTIARLSGFYWSKYLYAFGLFAPFLCTLLLVYFRLASMFALATFFALPFAIYALKPLWLAKGPLDPHCLELRKFASRVHLVFGLIYVCSFLF